MIVYLAQDIAAFVMYCAYGESRSSLLIESTDSMINLNRKSECNLKMPVCAVFINYMYIIWNAGVEVEYTLHNEYYYLLQVRTWRPC